jgi:hypothetical protein
MSYIVRVDNDSTIGLQYLRALTPKSIPNTAVYGSPFVSHDIFNTKPRKVFNISVILVTQLQLLISKTNLRRYHLSAGPWSFIAFVLFSLSHRYPAMVFSVIIFNNKSFIDTNDGWYSFK